MLAHELRNPLAPIRNAAEVIRLTGPEQPRLQWAREVIDRQLSHMVPAGGRPARRVPDHPREDSPPEGASGRGGGGPAAVERAGR